MSTTRVRGVRPMGDGIEVRFKVNGQTYRPRLPLKATAANLIAAGKVRERVMRDIAAGTFHILDHFPNYKLAARMSGEQPPRRRTVAQWFEVWADVSRRQLEHSSMTIYVRHMTAYWLPVFGGLDPAQITHEMILRRLAELAKGVDGHTPLSRKTQNNIMIPLRAVFKLICRAPGAGPNPCDGIDNLKVQRAAPDPFTYDEVEIALARVETMQGDAWRDWFEFAAFAGLRTSEQIALRWNDVDLRTMTIIVRRAKVLRETKARTKTHVERTVELNTRAAAVIERQRARTQLLGAEVFFNPATGEAFADEQLQRKIWAQALRLCGIRYRPQKELRDSSVTFALLAGADPWYVAGQHGHGLQTMLKNYAKWLPGGDRGRNRSTINAAMNTPETS